MPKASPPAAVLALHGYSSSDVARRDGRSLSAISRMMNGYQPWDDDIETAVLEVTGDPMLVGELKAMSRRARMDRRTEKLAQNVEVAQ